jgi:20S proteasome alpha/beta subunit
MTVCVAAFAADSEAIVLISDKAVTMGSMVSDTSICKMSRIGDTNWHALISGDISIADAMLMKAESQLQQPPSNDLIEMMKVMGAAYAETYAEVLESTVLGSKLLTKKDVFTRSRMLLPLPEKLNDEIMEDRRLFERDWSCDILVCGFDAKEHPHIFRVSKPGHAWGEDRLGYSAIGIGADSAIGQLMTNESDRKHKLERVLWDAFDAKVQAEIMQGIGYSWDAHILLKSNPSKTIRVPEKPVQEIMDKAIGFLNQGPFDTEPIKPEDVPPEDWKEQIVKFANDLLSNTGK